MANKLIHIDSLLKPYSGITVHTEHSHEHVSCYQKHEFKFTGTQYYSSYKELYSAQNLMSLHCDQLLIAQDYEDLEYMTRKLIGEYELWGLK
jgi:hypothetical protein